MKPLITFMLLLLSSTLSYQEANAGLRDKLKDLLGQGDKKENLEQLLLAESKIRELGSAYNKMMQVNQTINAASQAELDKYSKNVLNLKGKMDAFTIKLIEEARTAINQIEQELKAQQARLQTLTPAQSADAQKKQEQGLAAKAFWYSITPLTGAYNLAGSALVGTANLAKRAVGAKTSTQIKEELEKGVMNSQKAVEELKKFIQDPVNTSYKASHPNMQNTFDQIQALNAELEKARQDLTTYWSALTTDDTNQEVKVIEVSKAQAELAGIVKKVCDMASWTEAIEITTTKTPPVQYNYQPSAAFKACKKKYE